MKTLFKVAGMAAATLLLASCSNEEAVNVNENVAEGDVIKFSAEATGLTRAADVFCPDNLPGSFLVYAKSGDNVFIHGNEITKGGSEGAVTWNSANKYYWPQATAENEATFYGSKYGNFNWGTAGAEPTLAFTVKANANEQEDLLYARTTSKKTADAVKLNFRHALSQIVFKGQNTNSDIKVTVKGIKVCNVSESGVFTFPSANTDDNLAHQNPATIGEDTKGTWGNFGNQKDFGITFNSVSMTTDPQDLTALNDGKEYGDNTLLLIPNENLTKWNGTTAAAAEGQEGTYFVLDIVVTNNAKTGEDTIELWNGKVAVAADFSNWKSGMKYIYTFDFTNTAGKDPDTNEPVLVGVTFTCDVDAFQPVETDDEKIAL